MSLRSLGLVDKVLELLYALKETRGMWLVSRGVLLK